MDSNTQHTQPSTPYKLDSSSRHRIPLKGEKKRKGGKRELFQIAAPNDPPDRFTYYDFDRLICPKPDWCCPPRDEKKRNMCKKKCDIDDDGNENEKTPIPCSNGQSPFFSV
jgi:hypothetical protein